MLMKWCVCIFIVLSLSVSAIAETLLDPSKGNGNAINSAIVFSKKVKNLTLKKAYHLQKAYVKNSVAKDVSITGFKAGLMGKGEPQANGLNEPISGVLLLEPMLGSSAKLQLTKQTHPQIELELAYQISQPITEKISLENLSSYVSQVAPAIEIPLINFESNDFTGLDVVANNALAYQLMIGPWQPIKSFKVLDKQSVELLCHGKVIAKGKSANVLDGQASALVWLVNNIIDLGYKIQKGQVLITGNTIKRTPADTCAYIAKFGEMGDLHLDIKAL